MTYDLLSTDSCQPSEAAMIADLTAVSPQGLLGQPEETELKSQLPRVGREAGGPGNEFSRVWSSFEDENNLK